MTDPRPRGSLITLRPRAGTLYISHNRTVLSMGPGGSVAPLPHVGLFVCNARILSVYRWLADGEPLEPIALSSVEPDVWFGYYRVAAPAPRSVEVAIERRAGEGFHEDLCVTNFSRDHFRFTLALEIDADFADMRETGGDRRQLGTTRWSARQSDGAAEVRADYHVEHAYCHEGDAGVARFDAGVVVRVRADPAPSHEEGRIPVDRVRDLLSSLGK